MGAFLRFTLSVPAHRHHPSISSGTPTRSGAMRRIQPGLLLAPLDSTAVSDSPTTQPPGLAAAW